MQDDFNYSDMMMQQHEARNVVISLFENLASWPIKTAEQFRNAVLADGIFAVNPMLDISDDRDAVLIRETIRMTVREGRMIDFGYIPNEVFKSESMKSRVIFERGDFVHPYSNWIGVTYWEGGYNGYHVSQLAEDPTKFVILELYGLSVPNRGNAILVYDVISINTEPDKTWVHPYPAKVEETDEAMRLRGSNSLEPLVTMLRLLADASIQISMIDAPAKLNKIRAKQGRFQIPEHAVVHTRDYVTMFNASHVAGAQRVSRGGTHASPISHWRRSHMRHLKDGKVVPVKSSKINWREADEMHRVFYKVPSNVKAEKPCGKDRSR